MRSGHERGSRMFQPFVVTCSPRACQGGIRQTIHRRKGDANDNETSGISGCRCRVQLCFGSNRARGSSSYAPARGGGGRGPVPKRIAKTTKMFKSPGMYPNALAVMTDAPGGLWIGQQKANPSNAKRSGVPEDPTGLDEAAWLVDWNGKLLKTLTTRARNTSGIAYGNGCIWVGANQDSYGIFQVDMNSKEIDHRQIPLALEGSGGGCHGVKWHEGKLWIAALRLGGILRVDPATWTPEVLIRVSSEEKPRLHDVAFDNEGSIWVVTGINSNSYASGREGLEQFPTARQATCY